MQNTGCRCQIQQPFELTTSIAWSGTSATFLDMDSSLAGPASNISKEDVESGEFHGVLLRDDLRASGINTRVVIRQMKACLDSSYPPSMETFTLSLPATRDVEGGNLPVKGMKVETPTATGNCENCDGGIQADFCEGSKKLSLHRTIRVLQADLARMVFNGSAYCPRIQGFLAEHGAKSLDDVFGYKVHRDGEEWYQRQIEALAPKEDEVRIEGEQCDCDHCLARKPRRGAHSKYATISCSHTSNCVHEFVRDGAKDRCFGFAVCPH